MTPCSCPHPPPIPPFIARDFLRRFRLNGWVIKRALATMMTAQDVTDNLLPQLKMPVLIVWGSLDQIAPVDQAQTMHHLIPQSQLAAHPRLRSHGPSPVQRRNGFCRLEILPVIIRLPQSKFNLTRYPSPLRDSARCPTQENLNSLRSADSGSAIRVSTGWRIGPSGFGSFLLPLGLSPSPCFPVVSTGLIGLGSLLFSSAPESPASVAAFPALNPAPTSFASTKTGPIPSTAASATPSPGMPCSTTRCSI